MTLVGEFLRRASLVDLHGKILPQVSCKAMKSWCTTTPVVQVPALLLHSCKCLEARDKSAWTCTTLVGLDKDFRDLHDSCGRRDKPWVAHVTLVEKCSILQGCVCVCGCV
jgi:hypothetical protein